jgi:hypothetical protein
VPVRTRSERGQLVATLTSVAPSVQPMEAGMLAGALAALMGDHTTGRRCRPGREECKPSSDRILSGDNISRLSAFAAE